MSLSFIFPHPPEDEKNKQEKNVHAPDNLQGRKANNTTTTKCRKRKKQTRVNMKEDTKKMKMNALVSHNQFSYDSYVRINR